MVKALLLTLCSLERCFHILKSFSCVFPSYSLVLSTFFLTLKTSFSQNPKGKVLHNRATLPKVYGIELCIRRRGELSDMIPVEEVDQKLFSTFFISFLSCPHSSFHIFENDIKMKMLSLEHLFPSEWWISSSYYSNCILIALFSYSVMFHVDECGLKWNDSHKAFSIIF